MKNRKIQIFGNQFENFELIFLESSLRVRIFGIVIFFFFCNLYKFKFFFIALFILNIFALKMLNYSTFRLVIFFLFFFS